MRHVLFLAALGLGAVSLGAGQAGAADFKTGALAVSGAWSRPAVARTTGVGYMTLANKGAQADALTGAVSPLAQGVEIHSSSNAGGVMAMRKARSVPLPAGGGAAFAPGAYHLMFTGLKKTVKAGDTIPATLSFASGAKLEVSFKVGTGLGPPPGMSSGAAAAHVH